MSGDPNVRATEMRNTVARLDQLQAEVALKLSHSGLTVGALNAFSGALASLYNYIRDWAGVSQMEDSVLMGLKITQRACDELAGRRVTDAYGNLFLRATTDDVAFEFWCSYAQQTGETLAINLDYAYWTIGDSMKESLKATGKEVGDFIGKKADDLAGYGPFALLALFLVFMILLLK